MTLGKVLTIDAKTGEEKYEEKDLVLSPHIEYKFRDLGKEIDDIKKKVGMD